MTPSAKLAPLGWLRLRVIGAPQVTRKRKSIALAIALLADAVQLIVMPAFIEGAASPFDDALDAVVAILLLGILGFSARLVVALGLELLPAVALFPSWTAVVASIPVREEKSLEA